MKKRFVALGLVGALALGTCTVSAASGTKDISATFRNIKIVVDGKELSTSAEPFIYNGTTYLPIRAVGEAVGKEVTWNGGTNTVYLGEVPADAVQQAPARKGAGAFPTAEEAAAECYKQDASYDVLAYVYIAFLNVALEDGDAQAAEAIYADAVQAFGLLAEKRGEDAASYAEAKKAFDETYQKNILPNL